MDYELCKKLKEAGFPITGVTWRWKMLEDGTDQEHVPHPTLSELIEVCGDNLQSMIRRGNGEGDEWEARSRDERFNASTLDEAVAKLWLALSQLPAKE